MSYQMKKKIYISAEEKEKNQKIIDAYKEKFPKRTVKAQIIYKKKNSMQDYLETGKFLNRETAERYAKTMLEEFQKIDKNWQIIQIDIEDLSKNIDEADEAV